MGTGGAAVAGSGGGKGTFLGGFGTLLWYRPASLFRNVPIIA